jgi:hypothetical protein
MNGARNRDLKGKAFQTRAKKTLWETLA